MRAALLLLLLTVMAGDGLAGTQVDYSLIKGTVFAEAHPFRGAKVTILRIDIDAKKQKKTRKEYYSDRNGEFAFRMDVGPARFRVTVEAKGFKTEMKEVEVSGDERADISVILKK